ncbi:MULTISPECIES: hypothetical protein [Stenotrophomonas maltophilia group]|jgi:hypothetical protein|uniref:Lipoprotein n=1 Tax=Stenotrophomonas maltophilia TaxID=40324 RepID=A0A270NQ32_STEMA|nr:MULTISPECIES: hypothetical protein [Stenotrophomonas maltophilia group]MBA0274546.1 hypothetical protein [Stenotrophomonas maltophilia]MCO5736213.1 hypothetical protein [Stenotrophomonas maltophilia]MCO7487247.1 hypothetical protein [Stenotrophomonas maltophilia]MCU1206124.1 hypothetical protein [Stenotrophomonas maltophilia]PAM74256.1 hypothetical protein CEK00_02720 [Stenotrophomonas maltophilia]
MQARAMRVARPEPRGRPLLALLALVPLAACSPYADAERDVAAGGRGLAKLNPAPKQAYELVLTLKDAPGPFAIVEGVAQYDVSNYEDCGRIIWSTGTASRITSQEPVELRRVGENEYRGTFYLDRMQDQDYYDRGTCHWTLTGVGAMLRATNGEADTRFLTYVNKERMDAGSPLTLYYPKTAYPRAELAANFPASGKEDPSAYREDLRNALFSSTTTVQKLVP